MLRYFRLIVANSLRNPRRSVLTIASIAVSLCLLSVLMAAYRAMFLDKEADPAEALRLITHHMVSITQPMPVSYVSRIKRISGVREAMVWQWYGGTYKDARDQRNSFARFAIEPAKLFTIHSEIELPQDQRLAFERVRTACIAGRKLAQRFNWKPGDRLTLAGDIFPVNLELTIAGIYTGGGDNETLFFNYEYMRQLLKAADHAEADRVGAFLVQANSPEDVAGVAARIDREFENSPAPTRTESERAWQLSFIAFLGNLKLFLIALSAAITSTILLVSANTISMSVRERAREVGILKALGFTPGIILGIITGESVCIALAGGLSGLVLAGGVCSVVRHSGSAFAALRLGLTPGVAVAVLLAAVAIGVASSLIPAWSASRASILESLRRA